MDDAGLVGGLQGGERLDADAHRLAPVHAALTLDEALETTKIHSIVGLLAPGQALVTRRPFRAPHHTVSDAGLLGGNINPTPGEISLAHNGVLFLDELPEFDRHALEVLREPLETGHILISRNARQAEFPARFQLVAAMNPCPCGHRGDPGAECRCPVERIEAYRSRVSGPLLDRIDLHVDVPRLPSRELRGMSRSEPSAVVAARVQAAHVRQCERQGKPNAALTAAELAAPGRIEPDATTLLERAAEKLGLSARAYHRILRVALTIADLASDDRLRPAYVAEAITWRQLDRNTAAQSVPADSA